MRKYALKNTLVLGIIILLVAMTAAPIITGNVVIKKSLTDTKEPYVASNNLGKKFDRNNPPVADFTFTPEEPTTREDVYFTDTSTDPDGIIVSWWWNFGDGYYSDLQSPVHRFYSNGSYSVELIVTDDNGTIDAIQKTIIVYLPNDPPNEPSNPNPENGATGVNTKPTLSWNCSDPDGDPLTYDVYFGNTSPPQMILSNYSDKIWSPEELDMATTYYWKIVALDDQGNSKEGPIWSFTTVIPPNDPPNEPFITGPQIVVVGQEYTFLFQSSDLQGDDVRYIVTCSLNLQRRAFH